MDITSAAQSIFDRISFDLSAALAWQQTIGDPAKLGIQAIGAVFLTWLAFNWALKRFQKEKAWERSLDAFVGLVEALSELARITGTRFDNEIADRKISNEAHLALVMSDEKAVQNLRAATALARLLLRKSIVQSLDQLNRDLDLAAKNSHTFSEYLDTRFGILDEARNRIVEEGRDFRLGRRRYRWRRF